MKQPANDIYILFAKGRSSGRQYHEWPSHEKSTFFTFSPQNTKQEE